MFHIEWSQYYGALLGGIAHTMEYTVLSFICAVLVGLVIALLRISPVRTVSIIAAFYTEVFKNIPLLVIIFLMYFGLAAVGFRLGVYAAGVISMTVFYSAYLSEIFRAAITGVAHGQREAAQALGLSKPSTFLRVILPQAARLALPPTNTMLVDLLKATSLLVTISAAELMSEGQLITSETFRPLEVYIVIALIYLVLCYPLSQLLLWLENAIRKGIPLTFIRRRRLRYARTVLQQLESLPGR